MRSDKSIALTGILCLLLGFFGFHGIHRFYVGKVGTGILMFLTFGGLWVWTIIDLIRIVTGNFKDSEGMLITKAEKPESPPPAVTPETPPNSRDVRSTQFCTNCGHENSDAAKFCQGCGRDLGDPAPTTPTTLSSDVSVAASPPQKETNRVLKGCGISCGALVALIVVIVIIVVGVGGGGETTEEEAEDKRKGFHCLNPWDGNHDGLESLIRAQLKDPGSMETIQTRISPVDANGNHRVSLSYRARNSFGGMVEGQAVGSVDNDTCEATLLSNE